MNDKSQPEKFLQHKEPDSLYCFRCGKLIISCDCAVPMTKVDWSTFHAQGVITGRSVNPRR